MSFIGRGIRVFLNKTKLTAIIIDILSDNLNCLKKKIITKKF